MIFNIELCDIIIEIHSIYDEVYHLCKDYLADKEKDFTVIIYPDDIEYERQQSIKEALFEHKPVYDFPDAYLETIAVYRKIAEHLIEYDIIVFHGAAIKINDKAYIFTAKSGTGKTTHINLWKELYDITVINGDKPLLKIKDDEIIVYGSPWSGKENMNQNTYAQLDSICILYQDDHNHIEKITYKEGFDMLLQQSYKSVSFMKKTIQFIQKMATINLYKLGCTKDIEAAIVAHRGMNI